jgi:hypothetical protein
VTERDDDADDERLRSLRAVWLSMPDEDPPERGLAELLAAARSKAEEMAEPSWWERVVAMLRRPPVLALATVMILIGGAVLVANRSDKHAEQPSKQDEQKEAPASTMPEPTPAPAGGAALETPSTPDLAPASPPPPAPAQEPPARRPARPRPVENIKRDKGAATQTTQDRFESSPPRIEGGKLGDTTGTSTSTPKAGPAPGPGVVDLAEDDDVRLKGGESAAEKKPPREKQLHDQARSAATRGDCAAVRVTAQQIAKENATYFKDRVARDAALAKCGVTASGL